MRSGMNIDDMQEEMKRLVGWGWPGVLAKAACDPYKYRVKMLDGTEIQFTEAKFISPKWALLKGSGFNRGIEINLDNLVFVQDMGD